MDFDLASLHDDLAGRNVAWHAVLDSTMYTAVRLAREGCPDGTVVGADEQTEGHGRYGRKWHSEPGTGLYFSIVLRPRIAPADVPVVALALGLAAAEAITAVSGLSCDLRWPNDVLIDGKKCAGILAELYDGAVVAGIGVNVNQSRLPTDIAAIATSLRLASGAGQSRERLFLRLLEEIDRFTEILAGEGKAAVLDLYSRASSYVAGRRVVVEQGQVELRGVTEGLDASGFLFLRQDSGIRTLILAGGVRPCS